MKLLNEREAYDYLLENPNGEIIRTTDNHIFVNHNGLLFCETCNCNTFKVNLKEERIYKIKVGSSK